MNIIRYYNQNRKKLFLIVFVILSVVLAVHGANYLIKKDNEQNKNSGESSSSTSDATTTYKPQDSAISSSTVSDTTFKKQNEIIASFIKYCNEGNTSLAYSLLSTDCKQVLFPTLEYFVNNYYKQIFTEEKIYSIKNWKDNTYKINISSNILATGNANIRIAKEDYFTIVNEENEYKLNINGFVKRQKTSKIAYSNNIEIEIINIDTYMNYIEYTIKAKNRTNKTILLDSGKSTQKMYIVDSNNVKYMSYRNEVPNAQLKVMPNSENTLKIKYSSSNISKRQIASLVFEDVILDYNEYISKEDYTDVVLLKVEF